MPRWTNRPMTLYHGTDTEALTAYTLRKHDTLSMFSIDLAQCSKRTDFGQGFYTTSWNHQARNWANRRVRNTRRAGVSSRAVVLSFAVSRDVLADLECLCFVRADGDYWDLVADCRRGIRPHQRTDSQRNIAYDVVYGPVSLGNQQLVILDSDQVSFHTSSGIAALSAPYVVDIGAFPTGLLT